MCSFDLADICITLRKVIFKSQVQLYKDSWRLLLQKYKVKTQDLQVDAFLANMLRYIQFQKHKGDVVAKCYIDIQVPS